ncbi:retropepsin-like aspartic protease family protein [Novosphingobium album (ex Hu et al. 2023)]|uniref:TIGR02281 family clan AA aspartic protease n=1 Tax=Novosphingobium album (ex Hu et al. 2023) TaxID=2930093 RepID=A0ABT0B595_9SPHN|nr:TIGR02281 family clan AA aspartic protease [Novosphingobium album (ex Hu et al. 2023)]MCJ2180060.1 TIGR02281 family clan AA aspartic protease [Novosphingobium album (ex Hu et al. 2023)]
MSFELRFWTFAAAMAVTSASTVAVSSAVQEAEPTPMEPVAHAAMLAPARPEIPTAPGGSKIMRSVDGMFYLRGASNGRSVRFLVDTGASVTVLTKQDALTLGVDINQGTPASNLATVGGQARAFQTRLKKVTVAGRTISSLRIAVVDGGINVSLLGQNALSQLGRVTFEKNVMTLH